MEFFKTIVDSVGQYDYWVLEVFLIVVLALITSVIARKVLDRLEKRTLKSHNLWDDALVTAIRKPLSWFIFLIGITLAAQFVEDVSEKNVLQLIEPIRRLGIIILLAWFVVRLISASEANLSDPKFNKKPIDQTTISAIAKLLRMSVIITSTLVLLQSLGYSISGVLAFGGIGGIAVGFAAKDLLANFFGALMIYLDRPFSVGDWIRSPDKNIEGVVEDIGWRLTRIKTFDKRPLYIPNSTFSHISVENPSRMTNRRIYETIGIRYEDVKKLPHIITLIKAFLSAHKDIDSNQTLIVNFDQFAPSSLDFFIYTFTKTTDWIKYHEIKQDVLLGILAIITENGAECAFPTSTIHLSKPEHIPIPPEDA